MSHNFKPKQYIGIIRDHSASMSNIRNAAARDYNSGIEIIRKNALDSGIETSVSVIKCGVGYHGDVAIDFVDVPAASLQPIGESQYDVSGGGTPLYDSVGRMIELFESRPDYMMPGVAFLIRVTTDGHDNRSPMWRHKIGDKIRALQATDHWTFAFRVPRGHTSVLTANGVPEGNILEWEQTQKGMERATFEEAAATQSFYTQRSTLGATATKTFYTNAQTLSNAKVQTQLIDISSEVKIHLVEGNNSTLPIREFCEKVAGGFITGTIFYQLVKPERVVQDHKIIVIRQKTTGAVYAGANARNMLGLPDTGNISLKPGDHGAWDIYIQSKSVNRKLPKDSGVLVWTKARRV